MVSLTLFPLFAAASLANIATPGAGILLVVNEAISRGFAGSRAARLGISIGCGLVMLAVVSGLGVVLARYPALLAGMKVLGIAFLVYLGIRGWRAKVVPLGADGSAAGPRGALRSCLEAIWLQASNPQPYMFFLSMVPPFIDPKLAYWPQVLAMVAFYFVAVYAVGSAYAFAASRLRAAFSSEASLRQLKRAGSAFFFVLAAAVACTLVP